MSYIVEIGKNIVRLRKERGMSQELLADSAGISTTWMRAIEHGRANISVDTLESIAGALDIEVPMLFLYSLEMREVEDMYQSAMPKEPVCL